MPEPVLSKEACAITTGDGKQDGHHPMSDWQPMGTAPRDGTRVMVFLTKYGPFTAHWDSKWHVAGAQHFDVIPTHWMPLPAPPKTEGA